VASNRVRTKILTVGLVLGAFALTGCGGREQTSEALVADVSTAADTDGLHAVVLSEPHVVPHARLVGTSGRPLDLAADATRPLTLVFFGYTHCPDICQVVMANIAAGLVRLDEGQRSKVAMVFVTTDPARDTAGTLRSYLDRFDPSFDGATGGLPAIVRVANALGIPVEKGQKLASGGYDVTHGTQVLGLVPGGRAPFVWSQETSPGDLADDVSKILAGRLPG
jgi:protein SCO1/2